MKHAVVLAHPKSTSFCASIARTCIESLTAQGHTVVFRDLYAMDFDPRLKASELPTEAGCEAGADVVAERVLLTDVDSFIFVYPFWFNAPPAILKGYVDRVFGMRFGFAPAADGTEPLLEAKSLMSFSTSGAPEHWVNSTGALKALMTVFDYHLAGVCGLAVLGHSHFGDIVSNLAEDPAADMLEQVRAALRTTFKDAAPPSL